MGLKILIVEDEAITVQALQIAFEQLGYTICGIAARGRDAILQAEKAPPDVVIMDISLKGTMNGIEIGQILRTRFGAQIIFLTGHAASDYQQQIEQFKPAAFFIKPVEIEEIEAALKSL